MWFTELDLLESIIILVGWINLILSFVFSLYDNNNILLVLHKLLLVSIFPWNYPSIPNFKIFSSFSLPSFPSSSDFDIFWGGLYSMKSGFHCRFLYNGITIPLLYFGFEYHKRNHDSVVCFGKTHNRISISLCVPTKVILLWFLGKPITGSWFRFGYISFFYFVIIFNN